MDKLYSSENKFLNEIGKFKLWANKYSAQYGEWEMDYEKWGDLYLATKRIMPNYIDKVPNNKITNDLLYVIARDNEREELRRELINYPKLLRYLAKYGTESTERDARWQIPVTVAEAKLSDAADIIRPYVSDNDEYVKRRSLMSFAPFSSFEAIKIALLWLDEDCEYSRIVALDILDSFDSKNIGLYLQRLENDPSEYVQKKVNEIKQRHQ